MYLARFQWEKGTSFLLMCAPKYSIYFQVSYETFNLWVGPRFAASSGAVLYSGMVSFAHSLLHSRLSAREPPCPCREPRRPKVSRAGPCARQFHPARHDVSTTLRGGSRAQQIRVFCNSSNASSDSFGIIAGVVNNHGRLDRRGEFVRTHSPISIA